MTVSRTRHTTLSRTGYRARAQEASVGGTAPERGYAEAGVKCFFSDLEFPTGTTNEAGVSVITVEKEFDLDDDGRYVTAEFVSVWGHNLLRSGSQFPVLPRLFRPGNIPSLGKFKSSGPGGTKNSLTHGPRNIGRDQQRVTRIFIHDNDTDTRSVDKHRILVI